jgi:hypothetical protein
MGGFSDPTEEWAKIGCSCLLHKSCAADYAGEDGYVVECAYCGAAVREREPEVVASQDVVDSVGGATAVAPPQELELRDEDTEDIRVMHLSTLTHLETSDGEPNNILEMLTDTPTRCWRRHGKAGAYIGD